MSAVLVVNSPGYIMRLPPAVILTLFGSSFLRAIVYDYVSIRYYSVVWYLMDSVWAKYY